MVILFGYIFLGLMLFGQHIYQTIRIWANHIGGMSAISAIMKRMGKELGIATGRAVGGFTGKMLFG